MKAPAGWNGKGGEPGEIERLTAFAHDMRTPMCAVSGAAQMALSAREGADVRAQMEQILVAVRTMDRLLERLTSAQEAGEESTFTGGMLRRELLAMAGVQAADKGITLSIDLYALSDCRFCADYGALSRVLINLVSNAVKYTPPGGMVCVRATAEAARRMQTHLTFIVSDDGMGMKPEFMRRMYAPSARAEESAHLPGKGLGLSIVRQLVRQMGGTISARSEWGKGTVFTVRIPVRLCPQETEDTEKPAGMTGGMKVL